MTRIDDTTLGRAKNAKAHPPHTKIKRISISQQIHQSLRERIIALDLVPGESLARAELAEYYGVSQTPVRDAMLKLEEEGLLIIFPQSKTEVSKIDMAHARETQFLRLSIELEVTRRLAKREVAFEIKPVQKVIDQQESALADGDFEGLARLDHAFHHLLYELAGVSNLWELVKAHSGHIDRLRTLNLPDLGKPRNIINFHRRIIDAIVAGDPLATEAAVRGHLSGTLATADQIVARYPDYF